MENKEQIKEDNKQLISLRNNYFTFFIVITSGMASLFFINITFIKLCIMFVVGFIFAFCFLSQIQNITYKINDNIKRL